MNTLSGYSKLTLSDNYVLTAAGGHLAVGNADKNIPLNNGTVNTNLNADLLDGKHASSFYEKTAADGKFILFSKVPKSTVEGTNNAPHLFNIENEELISGYKNYWYVFNMGSYSGGNYRTQMAMPYYQGIKDTDLFIRSAGGDLWRTWRRVLHDNNYTSYTVKKDGTGATGTWNISISGNAATATNADKLDEYHETDFFRYRGDIDVSYVDIDVYTSGDSRFKKINPGIYAISRSGYSEMFISFAKNIGSTSSLEFKTSYSNTAPIYVRKVIDANRVSGAWKQLAFTDSNITGNANTATKLQTARTLTVGNFAKTFDGSANVSWPLHDILYNTTKINSSTSWDIYTPGVYYVASTSAFTGTNNPESANGGSSPYRYGLLIVSRANDGGVALFYISHHDSYNTETSVHRGIKFRTGWNNSYLTTWRTLLDTHNYSYFLDSRYYTETEVNNKLAGYLPLSGGTMTGTITMNTGTGIAMKYTLSGNDPWIYPHGADSYGIRYFEGNPDKMAFSATGNNTSISTADLCINGNGDGTVTIRGKNILTAATAPFVKKLYSRNDYERYVVLLCKYGTNLTNTYHRASGKIYSLHGGAGRYVAADIDVFVSDWSSSMESKLRFDSYGIAQMDLVTCTYGGSKYLAIRIVGALAKDVYFEGTSAGILFTPIYYYNENTGSVINSEINGSISAITVNLPYSNGIKYALVNDNITGNAATASLLKNNSTTTYSQISLLFYGGTLKYSSNSTDRSINSAYGKYTSGTEDYGSIIRINYSDKYYTDFFVDANGTDLAYKRVIKGSTGGWRILLDSNNSGVSGGGSSGGSSITVKINGTSKTLTIPTSLPANGGTSEYYSKGPSSTYTNTWDCNAPDRIVYSDYGSSGRSVTNAPSGWLYGTLLELGHMNYRGLNGALNMQLMWDVAHNTTNGGTLWFRGKCSNKNWDKSWCKVLTDQNSSVSGGGSSWGSSITVNIGGTSKTLTIPSNPNTDTKVTNTLATTTKFYLTGTSSASTNTGTLYFDTGIYSTTTAGLLFTTSLVVNSKLNIDSTGRVVPAGTGVRNAGVYGVYDSTKVGHIWSMGIDYKISEDGSSTGNTYGLIYFHTNWSNSSTNNATQRDGALITEVSSYAYGHQIALALKGLIYASLGNYIWSRNGFIKKDSNNNYILLGGGDHKLISDFSMSHSHPYIPLSGGTLSSGSAQIQRAGSSVSWCLGRSNAMLRINSYSGYNAIASMKTTNGDWSLGVYSNDTLYFTYVTDTNFNANTNTTTAQVSINASGNLYATHFYENSDEQLKTNIQEILNSDKMPIIKEFDWKESNSHSYGLIAQELEELGYSELVSVKDDGYKTVNYSAALSLIVGKLQVKIRELEKEIENLKNKN